MNSVSSETQTLEVIDLIEEFCVPDGRRFVLFKNGVDDGTRTRDNQNHNLALYQLNYIHHSENPIYRTHHTKVNEFLLKTKRCAVFLLRNSLK